MTTTKAARAKKERPRFVINALGECYRGDECVVGSVNVATLKAQLGIKREPTKAEVDAEFERMARESMTRKEYAAWKLWGELNGLTRDLFRIYTGVDSKGKQWANISTEFIYFLSDRQYKQTIADYAAKYGGTVEVMDEHPHSDKSIPSKEFDEATARGEEPDWRYGKDHGRPERQVSVDIPVWGKSYNEVKDLIEDMRTTATEVGLNALWVSVI